MDPAVAVPSACRHEWLPSPIGPAEYCGRCGAMRRRQADNGVADAKPTIEWSLKFRTTVSVARRCRGPLMIRAR